MYIAFFVPEVDPELKAELEAIKSAKKVAASNGPGSPRHKKKKNKKGKGKRKMLT